MNAPDPQSILNTHSDTPTEIVRLAPNEIEIAWSSGLRLCYPARTLRAACPCATCREKKRGEEEKKDVTLGRGLTGLPILSAAEAQPLTIDSVRPIGNYAYNISFSDGHHSGLFTLDMLRSIGKSDSSLQQHKQ